MAKGKYQYWIEPDGLLLIQGWARDGLTDDDIAREIGISRSTLSEWKLRFPDISDALKKSKEIVDFEVENALLKRALGYRYTEVTTETRFDMEGNEYEYKRTVEKEMPPDTTAQIFWLKNRKPAQWRDKPQDQDNDDKTLRIMISSGDEYGD